MNKLPATLLLVSREIIQPEKTELWLVSMKTEKIR
jgi:hypothetical protein